MPQSIDHLFVASFAIGLPVLALTVWYPMIKRSHAEGRPHAFVYTISLGVVIQWVLAAGVFQLWRKFDRPLDSIGLAPTGGLAFWISFGVFAGGLLFLVIQHVMVLQSDENRAGVMAQFQSLRALLPDTKAKLAVFMLASVTAGFCEEILYRGVLTWYLSAYVPTTAAYGLSTLVFGLGHAYQGRKGIVQTTIMGGIFVILMHFSGSIWLPMLLHAAVDINSGLLAYALLGGSQSDPVLDDE